MEKRQKFSIWYVLLGVWIVLIIQNLIVSMFGIKTIPYSEFLQLLKEDKVAEVAVRANQIQGKLKEGAVGSGKPDHFRTVRVDANLDDVLAGSIGELVERGLEVGARHQKISRSRSTITVILAPCST